MAGYQYESHCLHPEMLYAFLSSLRSYFPLFFFFLFSLDSFDFFGGGEMLALTLNTFVLCCSGTLMQQSM